MFNIGAFVNGIGSVCDETEGVASHNILRP